MEIVKPCILTGLKLKRWGQNRGKNITVGIGKELELSFFLMLFFNAKKGNSWYNAFHRDKVRLNL